MTDVAAACAVSLDARRQADNLAFLARGAEFTFGDPRALPLPPATLAAIEPADPRVGECHDGGLTARVLRVRIDGIDYAVKQARAECRVRNDDGRTSFLNELQRHAELAALRDGGTAIPGVAHPLYGSLRHGIVVSRWIDGSPLQRIEARSLAQVIDSACRLAEHGFFEWDFAPGNIIDDGTQTWLFDFGYLYRFDPLRQINTAGDGIAHPAFHPVERIESRNLFAVLLATEEAQGLSSALDGFALVKSLAAKAYDGLADRLAARGADTIVATHYRTLAAQWRRHLADDIGTLYVRDAWRAHWHDVDDDLRGQTCTGMTLRRAAWLARCASERYEALAQSGALDAADPAQADRNRLLAACRERDAAARRYRMA